jgi:glycopeptide antibiotics resistance protein
VEHPTVVGPGWALLVLLGFPVAVRAMRRRNRWRVFLAGSLLLYATAVVAVTIFPIYLVPASWRVDERWWDVLRPIPFVVPPGGFVLNIVMFTPLGVLLPLLWPATGTVRRIAGWGLAASAAIEVSQLAMWIAFGNRRMADVNDLMSNTAGAVFGLLLLQAAVPGVGDRKAAEAPGQESRKTI